MRGGIARTDRRETVKWTGDKPLSALNAYDRYASRKGEFRPLEDWRIRETVTTLGRIGVEVCHRFDQDCASC